MVMVLQAARMLTILWSNLPTNHAVLRWHQQAIPMNKNIGDGEWWWPPMLRTNVQHHNDALLTKKKGNRVRSREARRTDEMMIDDRGPPASWHEEEQWWSARIFLILMVRVALTNADSRCCWTSILIKNINWVCISCGSAVLPISHFVWFHFVHDWSWLLADK